ncbi:MAG: hypothetical protein JSU87_07370 [Gemmatimonadota bacterium]|nr:MAG: hypothetical protein JSU87_07370 [Gemmatimonadota bacterium]
MPGRDQGPLDPQSSPPNGGSGRPVRFRTEPQRSLDTAERIWQGVYSYADGWARFGITIDATLNRLTLRRSSGSDYSEMLHQLVGRAAEPALNTAVRGPRVEQLSFEMEIVGVKLTRVSAGVFKPGPGGDWLVVQAFVSGGSDAFLLGINDHMATGELFIPRSESSPVVLKALARVFG